MTESPRADRKQPVGRLPQGAAYSPLYRQVKSLILQSLDRGEWKPGEAIPSELELAARYQVSQGTVRRAIDELAGDNLLMRRQGKGTYVATHSEAGVRYRFLRLTSDEGRPRASESVILGCRRVKASSEVAAALALRPGDAVVYLHRMLSFGGIPAILDDIWLPGGPFRGLTLESLTRYRGPMYALFETEYGVSMVCAEEKIRAVAATEAQARLLQVETGAPLLQVERTACTYGDRPMELRRGHYVTTRYYYRNSLN